MRWLLLLAFAGPFDCKSPGSNTDPTPSPKHGVHYYDAAVNSEGQLLVDAQRNTLLLGGDGSPAKMVDGRARGPGGPIFRGKGPPCDGEHNHCLRDPAWFQADNLRAGEHFRALPVFELDGQFFDWRKNDPQGGKFFATKPATKATLHPGDPVVWYATTDSPVVWLDTEYDALNSSKWQVGYVGSVSDTTFLVDGWEAPIPIAAGRAVTQQK